MCHSGAGMSCTLCITRRHALALDASGMCGLQVLGIEKSATQVIAAVC